MEDREFKQDSSQVTPRVCERIGEDAADEMVTVRAHAMELARQNEQLRKDIADLQSIEKKLRESEGRYALAIQGANDGLWDWDLRNDRIYFSPRWKEMLGHQEQDIGHAPGEWFERIHPEDLIAVESAISAHLEGAISHFEVEHRMRHRDNGYRWMLTRGTAIRETAVAGASENAPGMGRAYRLAGSQTDTTHRKLAEQQLLRDAFRDVLTGLPNRALLMDRLDRSIARGKRTADYHFAVLFLDMDRFKVVNDSLGHIVGDQLLVAFAKRLASSLRPGDTVARLGGDEFTILLEDVDDVNAAIRVADRIHESLKRPFVVRVNQHSHEVFTTTSIGIAYSGTGYEHPQDLVRDADTAMYRAKASGKARHQLFDTAMHARAVRTLQIETDLRRALDLNQFEVHYQPIVSLESRRICSLEALARWRHPERGMISPADFIPVAEETGLIGQIGGFVLREACRQMAAWHAMMPTEPPPRIAVNLSARQFAQHDLVERIALVLRETGLDARHLMLEITESTIMESAEAATEMLRRLKEMHVGVNLDDFGTGYSSLAYLHRFPADTMKIDRSFVSGMVQDSENAEIVRTIVSLAHGLRMKVTAEGIETVDQLRHLERLDCEYAQGYYFSRPLDAAAMGKLLASNPVWEKAAPVVMAAA